MATADTGYLNGTNAPAVADWINESNVLTDNGADASCSGVSGISGTLRSLGIGGAGGPSEPGDSLGLTGIEVYIDCTAKAGGILTVGVCTNGITPISEETVVNTGGEVHGGPTSLWGISDPALVWDNPSFGVTVLLNGFSSGSASVDWVAVKLYYEIEVPILDEAKLRQGRSPLVWR